MNKRKSKFLTFIFSFIPGLSHVYLGYAARGMLFLFAVIGDIALTIFLSYIGRFDDVATLIPLPIIWLIALVDSFVLADKINMLVDINRTSSSQVSIFEDKELSKERQNMSTKMLLSILMSVIPGVGHMYLGLMRKGMQLMTSFFIAWYFVNELRVTAFMVVIPIIWAYSVFDAMHKASSEEGLKDEDLFTNIPGLTKNMSKIIGYGLIAVAFIMIFQSVAIPIISRFFDYEFGEYLRTVIIAIVFFVGGIILLRNTKKDNAEIEEIAVSQNNIVVQYDGYEINDEVIENDSNK
ncbi:hypothetical protein [Clostridium grantii]|uniref:TM2 domain-containing protein n=1 Tax=Clostridium grantii DSM 8605 TaxID=1121316 RepID=A0A1M5WH12_9CLOT|nr:hypothetical protein [Clostridium grantii]SHH86786.1 hypothetical protein SAMN02745207_02904 [Clostridium grantii DSM 8605]